MFHKHDCDQCTSLGSATINGIDVDYYYCADALGLTIVARYGSAGEEYISCPVRQIESVVRTCDDSTSAAMKIGLELFNAR